MSDGGKGSRPRPFSVDQKTFDSNWDNIFKKKKEVDEKKDTTFDQRMWEESLKNLNNDRNT